MLWHDHSTIPEGSHAPFAASSYSWLNYDGDKALKYYISLMTKRRGTEFHEFAKYCIKLRMPLKLVRGDDVRCTVARYVNDAIKYDMRPEQLVFYSRNFFGTADAIMFDEQKSLLRIHDLKTGLTPAKLDQLLIYDALFCLEYNYNPDDIEHVVCIYQNNDTLDDNPTGEMIRPIMDKIITFDQIIENYLEESE